jgi:glutathione S-transferase
LAEKGIALRLVPVDLGKGELRSGWHHRLNPFQMAPTLALEHGTVIVEVPTIRDTLN